MGLRLWRKATSFQREVELQIGEGVTKCLVESSDRDRRFIRVQQNCQVLYTHDLGTRSYV